jgi:hypothetical protein
MAVTGPRPCSIFPKVLFGLKVILGLLWGVHKPGSSLAAQMAKLQRVDVYSLEILHLLIVPKDPK